MVQVPAATSVTVPPDTVHRAGVVEAKLTARPEEAVAETANGAAPKVWFESAPKAMVWLSGITWKLWLTGVAGA
jgi:hypothetical protein